MRLKRLAFLSGLFGLAVSTCAQQISTTPTRDPQAISILQQSVKSMGGVLPADSVAMGNIQTIAGSETTQGTIRF